MGLSRQEVKEMLTADFATTTESLYAIVDLVFDKGAFTSFDLNIALEDVTEAPDMVIFTVDDVFIQYDCTTEEASEALERLNNSEYAIGEMNASLDCICEELGLKKK